MEKLVVINADDLGFSIGTNRGIEDAHRKGILTSACIMPTGPAFHDAIKMLKRCPKLGIGIHLSLTLGTSILSKKQIPDLVDDNQYFHPYFPPLLLKTIFTPKILKQIEKELDAQVRTVLKAGITIDHLNGQYHAHFIPAIFPIVCQLARKYKIPFVRVPMEPYSSKALSLNGIKWLYLKGAGVFLDFIGKLPKQYPAFYGILNTRKMDKRALMESLTLCKEGITEIITHPGIYDKGKTNFDFNKQEIDFFIRSENRVIERDALMDSEVRSLVKKLKLKLVTFGQAHVLTGQTVR